MSVTTFAMARRQFLRFYFSVPIGSKLRLKVAFVHQFLLLVSLSS
jgi:hypothetical protein